jgi:hypothetical protein
MKEITTYINEQLELGKKRMKFNIGDEVYVLKRHSKHSVTYYEILPDVIKDSKVITIVHTDKTESPQEEYKCTKLRHWTSVVFKTAEEAKQYCKDKQLKIA